MALDERVDGRHAPAVDVKAGAALVWSGPVLSGPARARWVGGLAVAASTPGQPLLYCVGQGIEATART